VFLIILSCAMAANPLSSLVSTLGEFGNVRFILHAIYMRVLTFASSQPWSKSPLAMDPGAALSKYLFTWLMSAVTDHGPRRRIW